MSYTTHEEAQELKFQWSGLTLIKSILWLHKDKNSIHTCPYSISCLSIICGRSVKVCGIARHFSSCNAIDFKASLMVHNITLYTDICVRSFHGNRADPGIAASHLIQIFDNKIIACYSSKFTGSVYVQKNRSYYLPKS